MPLHFIDVLVESFDKAAYFERATELGKSHGIEPKVIGNAMVNQNLDEQYEEPASLIKYLIEVTQKKYSSKEETEVIIDKILKISPNVVAEFKSGKEQVIGYFIGQVQKELKGKGDPKVIQQLLRQKLA